LAAGEITLPEGRLIVVISGLTSLLMGILGGVYLFATLLIVMLIGTLYSVPPLRFKMRAGWAALSISLARGLIANAGLFLYYEHGLSPASPLSRLALVLGLSFFFLFGVVIAVYKDIPDWAGDHQYRVRTFAVVIGRERIFNLGRWLLTGMYLLPVVGGLLLWPRPEGLALIAAHGAALLLFWLRSRLTDPNQPAAVMGLYRFLWVLFYAEYIFLGIYRLILVKV
jgi:homogentisate phytyltransferase/homogentisate geranylgeranyltransferase